MGCRDCQHVYRTVFQDPGCRYEPFQREFDDPLASKILQWLRTPGRRFWTDDGCPGFVDYRTIHEDQT